MSLGAVPPASQRPSRPPSPLIILIIVLVALGAGVIVGLTLHSIEAGLTAGAVCVSILRDLTGPSA